LRWKVVAMIVLSAAALKYTISGDVPLFTQAEVAALIATGEKPVGGDVVR
jgi:uncharacterized membrane protein (GlpM family)